MGLGQRIRNLRRYAEILQALVRYGFTDIVQELRLDRLLDRAVSALGEPAPAGEVHRLSRAARLRKAMEDLGPTFIKLGQVLSTRPDLVPREWTDEFKTLQDNCPTLDFSIIRSTLEAEFPQRVDSLFASVDPAPLAAASIAQVHRATLADGSRIVLKVLRPGIQELTATDMEILRTLADFAEQYFSHLGYSPREVVNEFARELAKEMDLTLEARATERMRNSFRDDPGVCFPRIHWHATTPRVLAMEEIQGILLSQVRPDQLSESDRKRIVANGARAIMRQCLDIGFFHADPHPGNLMALPGGRICFLDCGMTGQLDLRTTQQLVDLVVGVSLNDVDRVIAVVGALTDMDPQKAEDRIFRADVRELVSRFADTPLDRLNLGAFLRDLFQKLGEHRLRCPGDLVLLIKSLSTIEAVGRELDPAFDIVAFMRPGLERLVRDRYGAAALRQRLESSLLQYTQLAEDLPGQVRFLLTQLRRNRLGINIEHRGLERLTRAVEQASRRVSFSMVIAGLVVGSSILVMASRQQSAWGLTVLGAVGYVLAALLAVLMILSGKRPGRDR